MTGWDGIPDHPDRDGWHWIDYAGWPEPRYWFAPRPPITVAGYWWGGSPSDPMPWLTAHARYLGSCIPPGGP